MEMRILTINRLLLYKDGNNVIANINKEDGDLIVAAVNSYADLILALKVAKGILEVNGLYQYRDGELNTSYEEIISNALKTIELNAIIF